MKFTLRMTQTESFTMHKDFEAQDLKEAIEKAEAWVDENPLSGQKNTYNGYNLVVESVPPIVILEGFDAIRLDSLSDHQKRFLGLL